MEKVNLIICDDNEKFKENIEKIVHREIIVNNYNINISLITEKSEEVIDYVKNNLYSENIYFLEIELNGKNEGINLGRKIREYDKNGYIVFISSHYECAILTYKYRLSVFDYIIKSTYENLKNDIGEVLKHILSNKNERLKENYLKIDDGNNIIKFKYEDMLFIEAMGNHRIKISALNDIFEFYGALKNLEEILPKYYIRIHKSYIVNTKNIKRINKKLRIIEMINGTSCYYSRDKYGEILRYVDNSTCN